MIDDIKKIINQKIAEHKIEIAGCLAELDKDKGFKEGSSIENAVKKAQLRAILKDKAIFHRACSACLQDVLEDIEKLCK